MSCAKTAEPMEMLFGLWVWMVQITPMRRGNFGGKGAPIVKYRDCARELCWLNRDVVWDAKSGWPKEPHTCLRWGRSRYGNGKYWERRSSTCPM